MTVTPLPAAELRTLALFPEGYFLENLVVRPDGSILVTAVVQKELWWVPCPPEAPDTNAPLEPVLVHRFEHMVSGIVEIEPDVFVLSLSEAYTTHESHLARIDLRSWVPGDAVDPEVILTFDQRARGLNGSCLLGPGVLALADCFAGLIWRVDLGEGGHAARAREWQSHPSMDWDPDGEVAPPPQPGVNGVRYGNRTGFLYYTSTAQKAFMRTPVDSRTLEPAGPPELVAAVDNADDFCLDEEAGFAYVTRHRANTLERVPLAPGHGSEVRHLAGQPYDPTLAGPSAMAWRQDRDGHRQVAYVTTDGGRTARPPDGIVRPAALVQVELLSEPSTLGGRLGLLDPGTLDADQGRLFTSMHQRVRPWAEENGFLASTLGRRLIGPFNPALLRPRTSQTLLAFQAAEEAHTSLDDRVRQVVILTVGGVWQADYELYAHTHVARRSGLPETCSAALARGDTPTGQLSDAELTAHRVARELTAHRRLSDEAYQQAERAFGPDGVYDIVILVGAYQTVCGILTAFAVPAPAGLRT